MEAKVGVLLLTLFEGRNLKNMDTVGKQDPYMVFNIGEKYRKKSEVATDGGVNPYFKEVMCAIMTQDNLRKGSTRLP